MLRVMEAQQQGKNMSLVDANVVLRYLLDDHVELSPKAADILERHSVTLPVEVVYVLQKVYAVERKEIHSGSIPEAHECH